MFLDRSYPATGTTIGIERIFDAMEELNMFPPRVGRTTAQVLVARVEPGLVDEALRLAGALRQAGVKTELYFEDDPLKAQIQYARKKSIPYVAILGPDEVAMNSVSLRDMRAGQQETIAATDVAARITRNGLT
jgi:histidyl-tRNA synthetase